MSIRAQKHVCLRLPERSCKKVPTLNFFYENLEKIIEGLHLLT